MLKKVVISFLIIMLVSGVLAGCEKESTVDKNTYADIVQNLGKVAEGDECYYIGINLFGFFSLDKDTLELMPACKDATCSHTDLKCTFNKNIKCIRNYKDKILLTEGDSNKIYELNEDTYEMSVFYETKASGILSWFYIYNDKLAYSEFDEEQNCYVYVEDMETGEREIVVDRKCDLSDVSDDGTIYITTSEFELYSVNIESLEKKKLTDIMARDAICKDDKLYYIQLENNSKFLCSADMDGSNEQILVEDVESFSIYGDTIYYYLDRSQDVLADGALYTADLNGESKEELISDMDNINNIFFMPGIERIFVFDSVDKKPYKEYKLADFDGEDLLTGEVPNFWQ